MSHLFEKGIIPWNKGMKMSEGHNREISEGIKNRFVKKERKTWVKGTRYSEDTLKKMSETTKRLRTEGIIPSFLGKKHSEEIRKKISQKSKEGWQNHPRQVKYKQKLSKEEIRAKYSEASKRRWQNPEYRKNKLVQMGDNWQKMRELPVEQSANWQGGKSYVKYTIDFNPRFKNGIRRRDNQICMLCGVHREKLNIALSVHHINYDKKLSIPENCISLCKPCHMITGYNREYWTKFFQGILSEKYGYKYSDTQEIIKEVEDE